MGKVFPLASFIFWILNILCLNVVFWYLPCLVFFELGININLGEILSNYGFKQFLFLSLCTSAPLPLLVFPSCLSYFLCSLSHVLVLFCCCLVSVYFSEVSVVRLSSSVMLSSEASILLSPSKKGLLHCYCFGLKHFHFSAYLSTRFCIFFYFFFHWSL